MTMTAYWRCLDASGRIWPSSTEIFGKSPGARLIEVTLFLSTGAGSDDPLW